jgi:protein phosphatase
MHVIAQSYIMNEVVSITYSESGVMLEQTAIISDIHGNLVALEAVLADIRQRNIKRILCLGDLVGKGSHPAEVIDEVRSTCDAVIQGNWDLGINNPQELLEGLWLQQHIGNERLHYLMTLPFYIDFHLSGLKFRMFHASAKSVYHRVTRDAPISELQAMFAQIDRKQHREHSQHSEPDGLALYPQKAEHRQLPDVVGYGDIHVPYLMSLDTPWADSIVNASYRGRHILNVGSVGLPYDGIPQSSYVIIEGDYGSTVTSPYSIQFIRVPYDIDKAIAYARTAQMPDLTRYATELRTALKHS